MSVLQAIYGQQHERVGVIVGATTITYGQLGADIRTMAEWLVGHGLEPGMRIDIVPHGMTMPTYWDWIMHLGAIQAGLVHSTGALPAAVVRAGNVGRKQAVVGKLDGWQPTPGFTGQKLHFAPATLAPLAGQIAITNAGVVLDGREPHAARILRTSGTTGQPKLVMWDCAMIAGRLAQIHEAGGIDASTRLLSGLGFPTTAGFRYPLAVWQAGGCVELLTPGETQGNPFERASVVISAPFHLRTLLESMTKDLADKSGRVLKIFGGRVSADLRDKALQRIAGKVVICYGSTETGSIATGDATLVDRHPGAVGYAQPGAVVEVIGPGSVLQPAGTEGLIRVRTGVMCQSYAAQIPSGDRSPFQGGWFYPGDTGIIFDDGLIAVTGRMTETINIEGIKLSALTLEAQLAALPGVEDVCAVTVSPGKADALAIAVVCAKTVDLRQLRASMVNILPAKVQFLLVRVAALPRNDMGKVMRPQVAAKVLEIVNRTHQQRQKHNA